MQRQYQSQKNVKKVISQERQKALKGIEEVRIEFNANLAKLYKPATQQKGLTACHSLIAEHKNEPKMVRVAIGALTDKTNLV